MPPNPSAARIDAVIASKRAILDRLEVFARTSEFASMLEIVHSGANGDAENWLADPSLVSAPVRSTLRRSLVAWTCSLTN
jgi:hypothetical protein